MIEKLDNALLFLFQETNILLTLSVVLSLIVAVLFCYFTPFDQRRQTVLASFISLALIAGTCSLGLTTKAMREIGLKDYHYLVKRAGQHPVLNKALVHFINRNNNKINGVGFAVIKNQLSKIERNELRKVVDKERKGTRSVYF